MDRWQPDPEGLAQIMQLLRESQVPDTHTQQSVHQRLIMLNENPEFNSYMMYILTQMGNVEDTSRSLAGLILKNNVRQRLWDSFPADVQRYIKTECIAHLGDASPLVRATIGILITTIVQRGQLHSWPEVIPALLHMIESADYNQCEGAFGALQKVCEDDREELVDASGGYSIADELLPRVIQFFQHDRSRIRALAVGCVNQFIATSPEVIARHMPLFIENLYSRAMDTDLEVRKHVCQALVLMLESHPEILMPQIDGIIRYMMASTADNEESVALEACQFWIALGEDISCAQVLPQYLSELIPILLKCMRYSDVEVILLRGDVEDNWNEADRPEDIRPRFAHSNVHRPAHAGAGGSAAMGHAHADGSQGHPAMGGDCEGAHDAEDNEEDDEDDEEDDSLGDWDLRKCSAQSLDMLSTVFEDDLLPVLLPLLEKELKSDDWLAREAAVLALGAVAEGCMNGMQQFLPSLVPYLLEALERGKPLVRSIACWTLSRYAKWIVDTNPSTGFLQPLVQLLLARILDNNKRVQAAACSAFAVLEECAHGELIPYLQPILGTLAFAFQKYQHKNALILYDAIGTLADSVGSALNAPEYIEVLMPPLVRIWNQLDDDDRDLFPLMECLASVATALETSFLPYAQNVYGRCLRLIERSLQQAAIAAADASGTAEPPDKDFVVVALNLLSGMAEGAGAGIEGLVASSNLLPLLDECLKDQMPEVRQSSFALLGDLSKACFAHIHPHLDRFVPLCTENVFIGQPGEAAHPGAVFISVCNNATWAIGEIAMQVGPAIAPYVPPMLPRLIYVLQRAGPHLGTLHENAAITLGRLGLCCPELVAPHLASFVQHWCMALRNIRDNPEKVSAFRGMCRMVQLNPDGVVQRFIFLCDAIASWGAPPADLRESFHSILHGFKQSVGEKEWADYFGQFSEPLRERLAIEYNV